MIRPPDPPPAADMGQMADEDYTGPRARFIPSKRNRLPPVTPVETVRPAAGWAFWAVCAVVAVLAWVMW